MSRGSYRTDQVKPFPSAYAVEQRVWVVELQHNFEPYHFFDEQSAMTFIGENDGEYHTLTCYPLWYTLERSKR